MTTFAGVFDIAGARIKSVGAVGLALDLGYVTGCSVRPDFGTADTRQRPPESANAKLRLRRVKKGKYDDDDDGVRMAGFSSLTTALLRCSRAKGGQRQEQKQTHSHGILITGACACANMIRDANARVRVLD